jgi:hypothetical protein
MGIVKKGGRAGATSVPRMLRPAYPSWKKQSGVCKSEQMNICTSLTTCSVIGLASTETTGIKSQKMAVSATQFACTRLSSPTAAKTKGARLFR